MPKKKYVGWARSRWHMSNGRYMVEAPNTAYGKQCLEKIRAREPRFKGCRITDVIQAFPSKIRVYHIYQHT